MFEFLLNLLGLGEPKQTVTFDKDVCITSNIYYSDGSINKPSTKDKRKLYMDKYEIPTKSDTLFRKCVILMHGGSFDQGDKTKTEIVTLAKYLANQGYSVFSINYRLEGDNPPSPFPYNGNKVTSAAYASVVDLKSAIRYIKGNAIKLKIDKSFVFLVGESAGAIASVAAAVTNDDKFASDGPGYQVPNNQFKDSTRVNKVVSLWGSGTFVLGDFDKGDPPIMIAHGTKDTTLGASFLESILMASQCKKVGITCVYYKLEGFGHGAWDAVVDGKPLNTLISDFLAQ